MSDKVINVGLYGENGHQVTRLLEDCPLARLTAFAALKTAPSGDAIRYDSLAELLKNRSVELVSLCSPRRVDQASDAIACLRAEKHVYAEKPSAFTSRELDDILAVASEMKREFHEMADTVFRQPLFALRSLVRSGELGEVVQVWVQKSYPASPDQRPQDEAVDGGIVRQCAIHGVRLIEHLTGLLVSDVQANETKLGNPRSGDLRMAANLLISLENGGIATVVANYLNPAGFGVRANDQIRIFGTLGMAELTDNLQRSRVLVGDEDRGALETSAEVEPYFITYVRHLLGECEMPLTLAEEFHPLRVVNHAKAVARLVGAGQGLAAI